jgi:hypothetical protein
MIATKTWPAFCVWAYRAFTKSASAIRANIEENVSHTVSAKGAFIGADVCLGRFYGEVFVTIFAIGAQF